MFCLVCPQYFHVKAVHGGELWGFIGDDLLAASLIRPQTGERISSFPTSGENPNHSPFVAKTVFPRRLFTSENNANICNHGSTYLPKGFPVCWEISCFPLASCFLLGCPICWDTLHTLGICPILDASFSSALLHPLHAWGTYSMKGRPRRRKEAAGAMQRGAYCHSWQRLGGMQGQGDRLQ